MSCHIQVRLNDERREQAAPASHRSFICERPPPSTSLLPPDLSALAGRVASGIDVYSAV